MAKTQRLHSRVDPVDPEPFDPGIGRRVVRGADHERQHVVPGGIEPGIEELQPARLRRLLRGGQRPTLGQVDRAFPDAGHRFGQDGDLDDRRGLEALAGVVLIGEVALEVTRRDADPAPAQPRADVYGGVDRGGDGRRNGSQMRSRAAGRKEQGDDGCGAETPSHASPPQASTRIPFSIRRTSPRRTLPGPISSPRSTPSRASARTLSTQRTGESICRTRASRSRLPRHAGSASTSLPTGIAAAENSVAASSPSIRSRAGRMRSEWKGAETASGIARFAPFARQAAEARSTARTWPAITACSGEL